MSTHLAILPLDIIDTLTSRLNQDLHHTDSVARFLRLPHPRTGLASLFLYNPHLQVDTTRTSPILEVQAISPTNTRSWFLGEQVIADGKLLVMTPMDPLFLLVYLFHATQTRDGSKGNFRPMPDIIEEVSMIISDATRKDAQSDPSLELSTDDIITFLSLDVVQSSFKRVCDVKVISEDITVYRYSHGIVLENLRQKVGRLCNPRIAEMSRTLVRKLAKDGLMDDGKEELLKSGRVKLSCELLSQYLPREILEDLVASYDFSELNLHLKAVNDEELALSTVAANTGKRAKGANAGAGGNKKRKTNASQGVEKLKKANVAGMSKLSTFFTKKSA